MNNFTCPDCGGPNILVYTETSYLINTDEFWCHSVKTHDANAKVRCVKCDWEGKRSDIDKGEL